MILCRGGKIRGCALERHSKRGNVTTGESHDLTDVRRVPGTLRSAHCAKSQLGFGELVGGVAGSVGIVSGVVSGLLTQTIRRWKRRWRLRGRKGTGTKPAVAHSGFETSAELLEDWFGPIESGVRKLVRHVHREHDRDRARGDYRGPFIRKWRIKYRCCADSLQEAGDRLFTFTRLPPSQWKSARTTNAASGWTTRSSSDGLKRGPCCHRRTLQRCCSGTLLSKAKPFA